MRLLANPASLLHYSLIRGSPGPPAGKAPLTSEMQTPAGAPIPDPDPRTPWWRPLVGPVLVLVALVVLGRIAGGYWSGVQEQVAALGAAGMALYWVAFVLLAAACFPVAALGFSAGMLFGPWVGIALVFTGVIASGILMFFLGKGLLRDRIAALVAGRPRLAAIEQMAGRQTWRLNLLTRLSPFNYGIASYALAAGRSGLGAFVLGLPATLPSVVVWVWLGTLAREDAGADARGAKLILTAVGLVFLLVLMGVIGRMVRKALQDSAVPDETAPGGADVAQRIEVEEERDRLFNLSRDMLAIGGFDGFLQQLNPAWVRVLGWSRDELMSRPVPEFVHEDDQQQALDMFTSLAEGKPVDGLTLRFQARNLEYRWLSWSSFPYPGRRRVFTVVRDITLQKEAEAKLLEYQQQLRSLSSQLSRVEEQQRRDLATAIHDGLAQQLFGIRAQVTLLKYPDRIPDQAKLVQEILELVDQTMAEARGLSFELFPPALAHAGLGAALEWLGRHFSRRTDLPCRVIVPEEEPELPQDLRSMAYQCARELLTNAHKHAGATEVTLKLDIGPQEMILVVADDGTGFPEDPAAAGDDDHLPGGFGLFSIGERLRSIGGAMLTDPAADGGARVTLVFPLSGLLAADPDPREADG